MFGVLVGVKVPPRCRKKVITVIYASASADSPPRAATRPLRAAGSAWPLSHHPEAAGEARKITKEVLAQWKVAEEAADSVLLTVSELVTNAVEHAQPPLNLELSRDPGTRRVHIEVADGGPAATDGDWAAAWQSRRTRPWAGDRRPAHRRARRPSGARTRHPLGRREYSTTPTARQRPPGRRLPAALRQRRMAVAPPEPPTPARPVATEQPHSPRNTADRRDS